MKTVLICHAGDTLNEIGLARWLGSFTDLAGIVVIRETNQRAWKRIRREIKRVGILRFADVLAFRAYYRLMYSSSDRRWEEERLADICRTYPERCQPSTLLTTSPNSPEAFEFIQAARPDIMIARAKTLLDEKIFSIPSQGTFVMHPGICPEYRNAHGCFWALANRDMEKVGMTLLRADHGVDTGSVYGYYTYEADEVRESHVRIQHRVVFDNLEALRKQLEAICAGRAKPLDTSGRRSAAWGQPWLTKQISWKWKARKRRSRNASHSPAIP